MRYETLEVERRGAVTLVTINQPQALNALNSKVLTELLAACSAFEADESQECAVITGVGAKAFAGVADVSERGQTATAVLTADEFHRWKTELVSRVCKPWIVVVSGVALGGGRELAAMADVSIASDATRFGRREISSSMCLTGRLIGAEEAARTGLIDYVLPSDGLVEAAVEFAADIATPSHTAATNKDTVQAAFDAALAQVQLSQVLVASNDSGASRDVFVEKRSRVVH
jgi:enoyl-CoA hydratase